MCVTIYEHFISNTIWARRCLFRQLSAHFISGSFNTQFWFVLFGTYHSYSVYVFDHIMYHIWLALGLRSIGQSHKNRRQVLILSVIKQASSVWSLRLIAVPCSRGLDSVSTSPVTVKLLQFEWLCAVLVDSVSVRPSPCWRPWASLLEYGLRV